MKRSMLLSIIALLLVATNAYGLGWGRGGIDITKTIDKTVSGGDKGGPNWDETPGGRTFSG